MLTLEQMLEDSDTKLGHVYKWAQIVPKGSEEAVYRFIRVNFYETHAQLVEEGDRAICAGTITMNCDFWRIASGGWGSTTLNVGCTAVQAMEFQNTLVAAGRDFKDRYA